MDQSSDQPRDDARQRLVRLDILRGIAVLAMVVFHFGWDLSFLGLALPTLSENLGWSAFGHAIAASFLVLMGLSLVLAHGASFDSLKFLRRLGVVVVAALAVSLGTYVAMPEQFIYFGILHAIALGSLLALPFLRAPLVLVILVAAGVFVAPLYLRAELFSAPWLLWLGLSPEAPPSTDYVPMLPWFGFILIGIVLGRTLDLGILRHPEPLSPPAKAMAFAGRHSLPIYLLHQPLLYGGLWLLAQTLAPPMAKDQTQFLTACTRECTANGGDALRCASICTCAMKDLKAEKLWSDVVSARLSEPGRARLNAIGSACAAQSVTPP